MRNEPLAEFGTRICAPFTRNSVILPYSTASSCFTDVFTALFRYTFLVLLKISMQPRQSVVKNSLVYWIRFFVFIISLTVMIGAIEASENKHQTQNTDIDETSHSQTPEQPTTKMEEELSNSDGAFRFQSISVTSCPPGPPCDDCTCDTKCECINE